VNQADPASEIVLLVVPQPYENHNGGMIEFGPDNLLYIGLGDGGSGNDPQNHAQNSDDLLGKILRIDVDRPASASVPYSSPQSNPFYGASAGRDEIFATGFRNPWRFSFDRFNGQLYVGDVGQGEREEIDIVTLGGNYGWRIFEGTLCTNLDPGSCSAQTFDPPVAEYGHSSGRCSVTGGYVYRGTQSSLPYGAYIFADFCTGEIFMLHQSAQTLLADTDLNISSFGEDEAGEIYVVGLGGSVERIAGSTSTFTKRSFLVPERGGSFLPSTLVAPDLITGYARVQPDSGNTQPHGLAISGWRQGGMLVSEATLSASPLLQSGRIFAAIDRSTMTGMAFANPNTQPVDLAFHFTDSTGRDFGQKNIAIPAGTQFSAFLNENPFSGTTLANGTFTFSASAPISAMAITGQANQRSEFVFTTLPIVPLNSGLAAQTVFPHWAQGGGWVTDFALINTSDQVASGEIRLLTADGRLWDTLTYIIPPGSARQIASTIIEPTTRVGSARLVPSTGPAPFGAAMFRLSTSAGVITQGGVPAGTSGLAFRAYGEVSTAVNTGIAVANLSSVPTQVTVALTDLGGTGAVQVGTINLSAQGHRSLFLNEITGLISMATPFQGVLRITAPDPIAVTAFRCRINQRNDFLITSSAPVDESLPISASELFFPHLAIGGGYDLQFLLLNSSLSSRQSGTMYFLGQDGNPLPLPIP
jgi:hypothetical protein